MKTILTYLIILIAQINLYSQDFYPKATGEFTELGTWGTIEIDGSGPTPLSFNEGNFIVNRPGFITSKWEVGNLAIKMPSDTNILTLNSEVLVKGELALFNGFVKTNGNLILNFDNAYIRQWVNGNIIGKITVQKTISTAGWHYIGTCLDSVTFGNLRSNNFIDSIYIYNESILNKNYNIGWESVIDSSGLMVKGKGYACKFSKTGVVKLVGYYDNYNTGSSVDPTATSFNGNPESDNWNLMSNPLASGVDWHAAGKSNLDAAIYYYDSQKKKNICFVDGISINGGSNLIGSLQGFWVHAPSYISSKLTIDAGDINYNMSPLLRTSAENGGLLKIKLAVDTINDETVIRFQESSTIGFDSHADAYKINDFRLINNDSVPSLFTISDSINFAVNTMPLLGVDESRRIALGISGRPGKYTLTLERQTLDSLKYFLYDSVKDSIFQIVEDSMIIDHHSTDPNGRYTLVLDNDGVITSSSNRPANNYYVTQSNNAVNILNAKNTTLQIFNLLGQLVNSEKVDSDHYKLSLAEGFYILNLVKDGRVVLKTKLQLNY